jgi:CheY-like chemotaxis protein
MQMTVPFVTRVDISIPPIIGCNDIKLFQLSITLLSMLTSRIDTGILVFRVRLDSSHLLLTISNPSELESPLSWESDNALIGLVTKLVTSMSGEFEQNKCDSDCPEGFLFRVRIPVEDHLSLGDRDISRDPELLHFGAIAEPMFDMDVAGSMSRAVEALQSQVKPSFQPPQDATLGGGVLDDPNIRLPRKKRSLIIDDSLVVRKSIGRALERLGYEVKLAVDGREGLDCLKEDVFDMTLCDFLMPNLDGFDCVQQYRAWETENRRWFRQRIIGISAHANENDVKRGLEVGMDDFHEKPITIEFLKNLHESAEMASISQQLDDILPLLPRLQNSREIGLWQMNGGLPIPPIPSATPRRNSEVLGKTTRWPGQMSNCLICLASEGEEWSSYPISSQSTETSGWDITITKGSDDAMRSLKAQNWGAVIMSCQLSPITACTSITTFRQWEAENRVNRQSNVFLLSSSYTAVSNRLPDTERLTMQPPSGFDSTITFDTSWGDFLDVLFETTARSETANVIVR